MLNKEGMDKARFLGSGSKLEVGGSRSEGVLDVVDDVVVVLSAAVVSYAP